MGSGCLGNDLSWESRRANSRGDLTFNMPMTAGSYQLRFFLNNTQTLLATSNTVAVGGSAARRR